MVASPGAQQPTVSSSIDFTPSLGDILWCALPEKPRDTSAPPVPGPPHPVLVIKIYDQCDPLEMLIVPASTKPANNPHWEQFDVIIASSDPINFPPSGLKTTTRFKGSSIDRLPFTEDLFPYAPDFSDPSGLQRLPTAKLGAATEAIQQKARRAYEKFVAYVEREKNRKKGRT